MIGDQRQAVLPDVPTFAELGIAGLEDLPYYGFFAPAGTPPAVLDRFDAALAKVVAMPEVRERLTAMGLTVALPAAVRLRRPREGLHPDLGTDHQGQRLPPQVREQVAHAARAHPTGPSLPVAGRVRSAAGAALRPRIRVAASMPQRASAASSATRASTQRSPSGVLSFFQNGAWVFR